MAEAGPLVFEGITSAQYARLVDRAKAAGIEIVGDSGKVHKYGAAIEYEYVPETKILRLECTKTPFYLKISDVYARLRSLVNET